MFSTSIIVLILGEDLVPLDENEGAVVQALKDKEDPLYNATSLYFLNRPYFPATLAPFLRLTQYIVYIFLASLIRPPLHILSKHFQLRFSLPVLDTPISP